MKLSIENLNSHYGPAHILFDIALEVGEGEVVALLGRNGAGKSTTFRSIVGLVAQRSGRILSELQALSGDKDGSAGAASLWDQGKPSYGEVPGEHAGDTSDTDNSNPAAAAARPSNTVEVRTTTDDAVSSSMMTSAPRSRRWRAGARPRPTPPRRLATR